jgi:hypothetical protein
MALNDITSEAGITLHEAVHQRHESWITSPHA